MLKSSAAQLLVLTALLTTAVTAQDPHATLNSRGARAMGFDQQKTVHQRYETTLLQGWDARLATTPDGHRARLLDTLAGLPAIEHVRHVRRTRPAKD